MPFARIVGVAWSLASLSLVSGCGDPAAHSAPFGGAGGSGANAGGGTGGDAGGGTNAGSGGTGGTVIGPYVATDPIYDALYDDAMGSTADARWISLTGKDTGAGTQADPYATLEKALSSIAPGGMIIVEDGTYPVGADGWLNDRGAPGSIPSGSASAYTIVRAHHRFGVRLVQSAANYYGDVVRLESAERVWVDGFVIEKGDRGVPFAVELGRHNRLTRSIVVQKDCDDYGGAVAYGDGNVLEDVHAYGWGRYVFYGGTGGESVPAGSTVLRRSVSYLAGGPLDQPTASFAFYGSNDGPYAEVKDALFANCYEIDSPALERGDPDATKWGAFYHAKSVRNVLHHGCGVVNGGAHYGGFRTDNYGGPNADMAEYRDSFVAGLDGNEAPAAFSMSDGNGVNDGSFVTVCGASGGLQSGGVALTDALTSGVVHPVQRVAGSGAEQLYAVGVFLSGFGEPGFTTPQPSMPLWPFPYESFIEKELAVPLPKPAGFFPSEVTATGDPFAGVSLDGQPATLTRRIWEACGTTMPALDTVY